MTYLESREWRDRDLDLAKVLLVDDNPTARLTLQAVLQAGGGYFVDAASSATEALSLMDRSQYALVLADLQSQAPEASLEVLAHARLMEYQPAMALLSHSTKLPETPYRPTLVEPQDLPELLTKVADLISQRAARLVHEELRVTG